MGNNFTRAQLEAQDVFKNGGRVLLLGNSMMSGTSTFSGFRSPLVKALGEVLGGLAAYGTNTTQQEDLGFYGRYWFHDAVGGDTIAQVAARATNAIRNHTPDLIIVQGGENNGTDTQANLAEWRTLNQMIRAIETTTPIIYIGRAARAQNNTHTGNRAMGFDANMSANIQAFDTFINELRSTDQSFIAINPHRYAHNRWTDFYHASGDATHYNRVGYHQMYAIPIVRAVFGDDALRPPVPLGTIVAANLSSRIDIPQGATVTKLNAADTFYVTFADGSTTLIPAAWPVGPIPGHALVLHSDGAGLGAFTPTVGAGGVGYSPYSWAARI